MGRKEGVVVIDFFSNILRDRIIWLYGISIIGVFLAFMQCGNDGSGSIDEEFHILFITEVRASMVAA